MGTPTDITNPDHPDKKGKVPLIKMQFSMRETNLGMPGDPTVTINSIRTDQDFATKGDGRAAARGAYDMLNHSMKALEKELSHPGFENNTNIFKRTGDAMNGGGSRPLFVEGSHDDSHLTGHMMGAVGTIVASSIALSSKLGAAGGWLAFLPGAATLLPLGSYHVSAGVQKSIRRDFNGKEESAFTFEVDKNTTLFIPVTSSNVHVLSQALDAATRTVREARESDNLENLPQNVRKAMLDYVTEHGEKLSTYKHDTFDYAPVAPTDKLSHASISPAQNVQGIPTSGLPIPKSAGTGVTRTT